MPISEGTPQPTSTKAPKPSRCVTVAGSTVPGGWSSSQPSASSCARRRDRSSVPSGRMSVTVKAIGLPTRERIAISRVRPSRMPSAASSRGTIPVSGPTATVRSCAGVHRVARPSRTVSRARAICRAVSPVHRARFSGVVRRRPSGR